MLCPFRSGLCRDDRKPAAARAAEQRVQPGALRCHPRTAQHRQLADRPSGAHRRARLWDLFGEVLPGRRPQVLSVDCVVVGMRKSLEMLPHSTPNKNAFSSNHVIFFFVMDFFKAWYFSLLLPCRRQKEKKTIYQCFCFLSCFFLLFLFVCFIFLIVGALWMWNFHFYFYTAIFLFVNEWFKTFLMYCQGNAMVCSFFLWYFQCYLCVIMFCQFYSTLFYSITQGYCWTGNVAAKVHGIFISREVNQVCSVCLGENPFHSVVKTNLFHPFLSIMKLQRESEREGKKKRFFYDTCHFYYSRFLRSIFYIKKKKEKKTCFQMTSDDYWL